MVNSMMKSIAKLMLWLALTVAPLVGQSTSVTLNVSDADGQAWLNGTYSASLYSPPGVPGFPYYVLGSTVQVPNQNQSGNLDASGTVALTLTPNASVGPSGTKWQFVVCPNSSSASCFTQAVTIAGASQTVNVVAPAMRVSAGPSPNVRAYSDIETVGSYGSMYYNTISNVYKVCQQLTCNGSGWGAFGSQGLLSNVTSPWIEGEGQAPPIDCTGGSDSSAGFVAWLLSGSKRKEVPGDCKIKIQANAGHGAIATGIEGLQSQNAGWVDIFGGNGAEIFGCGAGTGAVVNFNRSGYFHFHGFVVQPTDTNLCPGGSTFTRNIDWTNNGGGGSTSTKAEFDHLRLISTGLPNSLAASGVLFPTLGGFGLAANQGSLVAFIAGTPSWSGLMIQQVTGTNIVNGTAYSVTAQDAISGSCCGNQFTGAVTVGIGKCLANCSSTNPNGTTGAPVVTTVASTTCNINSTNTWSGCTANYTGTVGDSGNPIVIQLSNSSAILSGKLNQVWFDNLTATNITISNPSFESLNGGATLGSNGAISPAVGTGWGWANFPQYIGLQVGSIAGEANLEGANFHDIDVDGADNPGSVGIYDQGCCSEHNPLINIGMFNIYRGITGSMPWPVITNLHGGGGEGANQYNYQVFGIPGGALIAGSIGGVISNLSWDGFGPLYNSAKDANGNAVSTSNNVVIFINPLLDGTVHATGEYDIDVTNMNTVTFDGGVATNITGGALNNTENSFVGMAAYTGNSCCGTVNGLQTVAVLPAGLNGSVLKGSHILQRGTIASGTTPNLTNGSTAIAAGTCATVVTVSAPGVNPTGGIAGQVATFIDSISWGFTTSPSGAYTQGLVIQQYATTDNVNFLVCNPTAGSLTPPAKALAWSVTR